MTPVEAINILGQATEPTNITRISRAGLVQIQHALEALIPLVQEWEKANPPPKEPDNVVPLNNGT